MHICNLSLIFAEDMTLTIIILLVTVAMFVIGKLRADIVALCALVVMILCGILTPAEALAGFSNPVVIMMVGLFVVGGGILQTGLAKAASRKIMSLAGGNDIALFMLVILVTAIIGAFVSNTGTVALMMPIVVSMAAGERCTDSSHDAHGHSTRKDRHVGTRQPFARIAFGLRRSHGIALRHILHHLPAHDVHQQQRHRRTYGAYSHERSH